MKVSTRTKIDAVDSADYFGSADSADSVSLGTARVITEARVDSAIRAAELTDVAQIHALLKQFSDREVLLPRSEGDLYQNLREFLVIQDQDSERIIACAALQIFTAQLGEVRSLAVAPRYGGRGLGRRLVHRIEQDARALGLRRLMALTYETDFFHKLGFQTVEMRELPEKVWGVCVNCPKFLRCDEIAVVKTI